MASAAEQLAANLNFGAFAKAEELKKRIWFTLGALLVYRLGTYIPLPGINPAALAQAFNNAVERHPRHVQHVLRRRRRAHGDLRAQHHALHLGLDHHAAADLGRPAARGAEEGRRGRAARSSTSTPATARWCWRSLQAYGIAVGLEGGTNIVIDPGHVLPLTTVVTLTGGTMFLMWLGEQITARGIGNGISLIIFSGIVANLPHAIGRHPGARPRRRAVDRRSSCWSRSCAVGVIAFIVFMERAQRRLLIQYPKRQVGNRMFQGDTSHLPLKLNTSGVIPPIFASSLLLLPATVANFTAGPGSGLARHDHRAARPRPAALHAALRRR